MALNRLPRRLLFLRCTGLRASSRRLSLAEVVDSSLAPATSTMLPSRPFSVTVFSYVSTGRWTEIAFLGLLAASPGNFSLTLSVWLALLCELSDIGTNDDTG